ncbi:hypothetical protein L5515_009331 [Caenorhabditis briggsae]|uniref:F-box domain-containing protein n=1 Tax=Caenorhabditis briggsae TaxID=6238 RepID=A0AAE9JPW0_CAEBR|nr:hypothetical protein L5515_009331 [Caenorhabditis briggsae]
MENRSKFRFLNLPFVVAREVLNTMDPFDILDFSRASKRCRVIATTKKASGYQCSLAFNKDAQLMLQHNKIFYSYQMTNKKENDGKRRTIYCGDCTFPVILVYSENFFKDMMNLYSYASSVIKGDVDGVSIWTKEMDRQLRSTVDWLRSEISEIPILQILDDNVSHADLQYTLDSLTPTRRLKIFSETIERLPLQIRKTCDELRIVKGSWIDLHNAMSFDYTGLALYGTELTNQDLNTIIKSWIEMKWCLDLICFNVNLVDPDNLFDVALGDISHERGEPFTLPDPEFILLDGGVNIKRKDGLMRSVHLFDSPFGIIMRLKTDC